MRTKRIDMERKIKDIPLKGNGNKEQMGMWILNLSYKIENSKNWKNVNTNFKFSL